MLAARRDGTVLSASLCSAQSTPDDAPNNQDASHSLASHGQACGYCNLLAHMPAMPSVQPACASRSGQPSIALPPGPRAFGAACHSLQPNPAPHGPILI
ncbi:DUF2946 family protein [Paraburkholderia kirstenboschensis]|uniref:DUF2946 domain-containing protein n=1 Tax=Paraburkholderia kirstenboschensis TaxID=1245436 RepID=A0ABZ0EBT2_9BURK|nr:DUF2946 family protein [Paraburkholderia kirstenboschensis]WOD14671.1 hypothetical protein RW095_07100 [Paraburkholderia kirstenboschensis]